MLTVVTMNYTRKRVMRAVRELSRQQERITYSAIADYAGCSYMTVRRAVKELRDAGIITAISSGKGHGYKFTVAKCRK
jgi:DNA-binding Lrp family transcriptional regulator